jgi:hypothetical protein
MATTTNYGWTTPDDTALVKDGASAIRTLGTSVDTTTKNLNPSTTLGDIEYRSSTANVNTRLPLGTAGQVLKVNSGATAPEWATDASGMTNPMTTTGDTIYSSSGSTPARLAIGSTGNVLTVAGGVPTWAAPAGGGSLTLLSTTTISGTSTTVSSISQSYKHLYIMIYGVLQPSASPYRWETNISGSVYTRNQLFAVNSITQYALAAAVGSAGDGYNDGAVNPKTTGGNNLLTITIENYANTNIRKLFYSHFGYESTSLDGRYVDINGVIASNTAISSFIFSNMASGSMTGGTIQIYGVN